MSNLEDDESGNGSDRPNSCVRVAKDSQVDERIRFARDAYWSLIAYLESIMSAITPLRAKDGPLVWVSSGGDRDELCDG